MITCFYLTQSGTTIPSQSGPESNSNERELHIPKAPGLEPHHLIIKCHILDTQWGGLYRHAYSTAPADLYALSSQPHMYYILFTHPSARAGYDTRSIFKRSLTGLNSEFSFS